jgi:hypothetical protein
MVAPIERRPRVVDVDPVKRGCEVVRITLAPDFAVGDDVQSRPFLISDCQQCGVGQGVIEVRLWYPPQLARADPRRKPTGEFLAIDKPRRLWITADK